MDGEPGWGGRLSYSVATLSERVDEMAHNGDVLFIFDSDDIEPARLFVDVSLKLKQISLRDFPDLIAFCRCQGVLGIARRFCPARLHFHEDQVFMIESNDIDFATLKSKISFEDMIPFFLQIINGGLLAGSPFRAAIIHGRPPGEQACGSFAGEFRTVQIF